MVGAAGRDLLGPLIAAVLLAGAFAVGGPLLSFRSDLAQLREIFQARVRREALLSAQVLSRHLRLLEGELFRLAKRPEIDPTDSKLEPEQDLLDLAHRHSVLFGQGVAVLDAGGERVWSEPESLFRDERLAGSEWFLALRAGSPRVVDAVHPGSRLFLVGVPVLRHGRFVGVVVGAFDPEEVIPPMEHTPLYLDSGAPLEMVVVDESGDLLSESRPPDWALVPDLGERVTQVELLISGTANSIPGLRFRSENCTSGFKTQLQPFPKQGLMPGYLQELGFLFQLDGANRLAYGAMMFKDQSCRGMIIGSCKLELSLEDEASALALREHT